MPPRWLSLAIVVFWLGITGPLLWKEWRRFLAGEQPVPYTIDPVEEYQGDAPPLRWSVHVGPDRPGELAFVHNAQSWVRYDDAANTYAFHSVLSASSRADVPPLAFGLVTIRKMTSVQTVERDGRLRAMSLELICDLPLFSDLVVTLTGTAPGDSLEATVTARVGNGLLFGPHALPPTRLPGGSALQPLHLVNRIRGLRPGQTWELPMLDPIKTSANITGTQQAALSYIDARVLPEPQALPGHPDILCHVIEYDTDIRPKTWVQIGTDYVVRQEVVYEDTRIVIQRVNLHSER